VALFYNLSFQPFFIILAANAEVGREVELEDSGRGWTVTSSLGHVGIIRE